MSNVAFDFTGRTVLVTGSARGVGRAIGGCFRAAEIRMGRFAEASEMAAAVAFSASDEAAYITGVVLPVDGGLSM